MSVAFFPLLYHRVGGQKGLGATLCFWEQRLVQTCVLDSEGHGLASFSWGDAIFHIRASIKTIICLHSICLPTPSPLPWAGYEG